MVRKHIFALDIGTRSVVGVILEPVANQLKILAAEVEEHHNRSMQDGQIHDIEEVTKVVSQIKSRLENRTKISLRDVAVAAAGRALKTIRCMVETGIEQNQEISKDDVLALELQGVQEAQRRLLEDEENRDHNYHCVGYSIVQYLLNGRRIKNLVGQRGESIALEILATFLPREVVDSLFAVLDRTGLEMTSLTLEPIAASEVVIPESMRQLSLALVDVGAGTSDIALCADGTMIAFAMVPEAGDEITEALAEAFLLDFNEAENIKRQVNQGGVIKYTDVLGTKHEVLAEQIAAELAPKVYGIANKIAEKILTLSTKPTQAVICIGGGSLTPGLPEALAKALGLSPQRVAVRGREVVDVVGGQHKQLKGPDSITPLGIAVTAFRGHGLGFSRVMVNGRPVRLFELNQGTVADALLAAGLDTRKLTGKPGMSMSVTVNREIKLVKGSLGTPAIIKVNGKPARLDTRIVSGGDIFVQEAINGRDGSGTVNDVLTEIVEDSWVKLNGRKIMLRPIISMNGSIADRKAPLQDLAEITWALPNTVAEIISLSGISFSDSVRLSINGVEAALDSKVSSGDELKVEEFQPEQVQQKSMQIESFQIELPQLELNQTDNNSSKQNYKSIYVNNEIVEFYEISGKLMFYDVLGEIEFLPQPPFAGAVLKMEVNGIPASFTTAINSGDRLLIEWHSPTQNTTDK
ncbi:MAG: cell division FtsA domain-containing protein [Carboxydocellales bacterium]